MNTTWREPVTYIDRDAVLEFIGTPAPPEYDIDFGDGHFGCFTATEVETGVQFDGYLTCGPHDEAGNHVGATS